MIYENKIKSAAGLEQNFLPVEEGIRRVAKSYFAFHADHVPFFSLSEAAFTDEQKCALEMVDPLWKGEVTYLSMLKNSSYFEYLRFGLVAYFQE